MIKPVSETVLYQCTLIILQVIFFLWISIYLSIASLQNNSSVLYYVASNDEDCLPIMHHECHMISYYFSSNTTTYFLSNTTFIFLPGIHVLPNSYINLSHFNWLTLKGHLGAGTETPELYNITLVIQSCYRVTIKDLKITYTRLSNNNNVEINSGIMNKIISTSSTFMTNISIYNMEFSYSVILDNARVILHNVTVLHNKSSGIHINKMGNQSSLTNVTVKCNVCIALFLKGHHGTSHINIKDIIVIGGKIHIEHIRSHLSLSNVKVTIYQQNPCRFYGLLIESCGNNISVTDVLIVGAQITISSIGSHFIFKNVTIINKTSSELTLKDFLCSLLFIEGGINSKHVNIISVTVVDGKIHLSNIGYDLSITDIYTNVALIIDKNGPLISICDSFIIGMMLLINNDNNITLTNTTVGYRFLDINLPYNNYAYKKLNITILMVAINGNNVNINNITLYNGIIVIMHNGNKITIQNITIDVNATFADTNARRRLFLDPKYKVELSGLAIVQNNNHITIDNVKMSNSTLTLGENGNNITLSKICIHSFSESHGVLIGSNGDNITLSDITVDGYGEISITNNGDYMTIKNKIQSSQFIMLHNGNNISVVNVTATNNTNLSFQSNGDNITLNNVTITGVSGGCGLVFLYNKAPLGRIILSNVTVSESNCGIYAYGWSILHFLDYPSKFINNTSINNGAGMQISRSIILHSNTDVYFINNTAYGVGGAIYVDIAVLEVERIIEHCTFQNFRPLFKHNTALVAGNNVYNGKIWKCKGIEKYNTIPRQDKSSPFTSAINCTNNTYLKRFPTPLSAYITSTPIGVCLCDDNNNIDCYLRSINMQLYPGQYITLSLVTVGMCGGISPSILVMSNSSTVEVLLNSSENQETEHQCKNFTYQLTMNTKDRNGTFLIKHKFDSMENQDRLYNSYLTVNTLFLQCPVGLELILKVCQCNHVLSASNVIDCNIVWMPRPIKKSGNNWLYYNHDYNCTAVHKYCPFDYCTDSSLYLSLDNGDVQCSNGRAGILCGGCQMGLSLMLGSNRCHSCENKYLSLVIAFILAGMALVAFLLVCNMTVSVGTINGLLFYANIVKLNEVMFFPNGVNVPVLSQFIAWLNLDLGIETCFFDGLDGYWKTWLQFVFPVYIWLLIGAIIVGSHYSSRVCRLCGNNAVPVLATLILMSYTKLLQNVTKSLMSSTINCEGVKLKVWSVDGNIDYLSPKHIPLFVTAMFFLIVGLVYTGLVFTAQWLQRYSGKCCKSSRDPVVKLKPLIDAYTGPYKDKYRFWTGLLLIVRLILTPVFSYTTNTMPQINNYIIAFISAVALYSSRSVYRHNVLNALEAFYFLSLGILTLLNIYCNHVGLNTDVKLIMTIVSVSMCLATFTGSVLIHLYITKCHKKISPKKNNELEQFQLLQENNEENAAYSPSHTVMRRESMIFDFSITDEL